MNGWAGDASDRICAACSTNGGWEGWAQVEVALWWSAQQGVEIIREEKLWNDNRKADLIIKRDSTASVVELKCKTLAEEGGAFAGHLRDDYDKLNSLHRQDIDAKWVYGLYAPPVKLGYDMNLWNNFDAQMKKAAGGLQAVEVTNLNLGDPPPRNNWYYFRVDAAPICVFWCQL